MSDEPTRLVDFGDASVTEAEYVRGLLLAEQSALPPDDELESLVARLGPALKDAERARAWWPKAAVSTLAGVLALGIGWLVSPPRETRPADVPPPPSADVTAELEQETFVPPPSEDLPATPVESLPNASTRPRVVARVPSSAPACSNEVELLDRADVELRSGNTELALSLADEHAERCPAGAFVQERERIAIEALAKLGRSDAMIARERAFERQYPLSPHLRRIRSVVAKHRE